MTQCTHDILSSNRLKNFLTTEIKTKSWFSFTWRVADTEYVPSGANRAHQRKAGLMHGVSVKVVPVQFSRSPGLKLRSDISFSITKAGKKDIQRGRKLRTKFYMSQIQYLKISFNCWKYPLQFLHNDTYPCTPSSVSLGFCWQLPNMKNAAKSIHKTVFYIFIFQTASDHI